jgi:hypothetical protein
VAITGKILVPSAMKMPVSPLVKIARKATWPLLSRAGF